MDENLIQNLVTDKIFSANCWNDHIFQNNGWNSVRSDNRQRAQERKRSGLDGNPKSQQQSVDLDTIQRNIETAAGMVAHHTKSEREK